MLSNNRGTSDHASLVPVESAPDDSPPGQVSAQQEATTGSEVRRATRRERLQALRVILGGERPASQERVLEFLRYAVASGVDLGELRVMGPGKAIQRR